MNESLLYLLVNEDATSFKVGISVDPSRRASQIPHNIDFKKSIEYPVLSCTGNARKIETTIHYLFREHRKQMPYGDGYTEWFDIDILDDVVAFLNNQSEMLGIGTQKPVSVPMQSSSHANTSRDRKLHAEKLKAQREEYAIIHNSKEVLWLRDFLTELDSRTTVKGILLYPDPSLNNEICGKLFFSGLAKISKYYMNIANSPDRYMRYAGGGLCSIFPSGSGRNNHARGLVSLSINNDFLYPAGDVASNLPSCIEVWEMFQPFISRASGPRAKHQLDRLIQFMHGQKNQHWI
jgi:hypothetical protein